MATSLTSIEVVAGDDILASEYNLLRDDVINLAGDYATAAGSGGAFTLSVDSTITAYVTGMIVKFKANHTPTGSVTLNVNSIGAKTIKKRTDNDLEGGDITNGQLIVVQYDGTNFQMVSPPSNGAHFEDPGTTTEGSQETGDTTKTVTVTTNFQPRTFDCIVHFGIVKTEVWSYASSAPHARVAARIKGEVGGDVSWFEVEKQESSAPNANPSLNPYGDEDEGINKPDYGEGTASSPGLTTAQASGGVATFALTSITATATTLVFTFTFTHNSENSGLRYGVRFLSVEGE